MLYFGCGCDTWQNGIALATTRAGGKCVILLVGLKYETAVPCTGLVFTLLGISGYLGLVVVLLEC